MNARALSLLLFALLPMSALAEVSDKAASIPQLWLTGLIAGAIAFLIGRYRVTLGAILLPVSALIVLAGLEPVRDPFVGPAVIAEQGGGYLVAAYGSAFMLLGLHLAGLWLGWHRRHKSVA